MRQRDRLDTLLAGAAFLAATARTWPLVAPTDASFHLVRVGDALFRSGIGTYASPPGGEGAPILGALVGAASALFAPGNEDLGRAAGAVCAGLAAALLTWALASRTDRLTALLGAALLAGPAAFASAFVARPDAAAGGLLLLAALTFRWKDARPGRALALAWTATLATPSAWPAALAIQLGGGRPRRARDVLPAAGVLLLLLALSLALPAGSRSEILRGIFSDWTITASGWPSTGGALARVWAFGALLAAPLLLLRVGGERERALVLPWAAAVVASIVLCRDGLFRETMAAWAPATCLLLALAARAVPDAAGPGAPRRAVLAGFAVPVAFLLLGRGEATAWRTHLREEIARETQVAEFLWNRYRGTGAVLSERCGVLAATSGRETRPLRGALRDSAGDAPSIVLFAKAIRPETRRERRLFASSSFLSRYAPLLFRRGPTRGVQDAIWVLRRDPVTIAALDPGYAESLREGWSRHADRDVPGARRSFQAAATLEPEGLGIAHEWAGLLFEGDDENGTAELLFRQALPDPATALARGHLADRALSRGELGRADALIAQAFEFTEQEASLWGLRARLQALAGDPASALQDSERAVWLNPLEGRLLANHGILLWMIGQPGGAREFWRLAARSDRRVVRYLGDFENAPDDAPAPPLLPLYSLEGFHPDVSRRPGDEAAKPGDGGTEGDAGAQGDGG